MTIQFKLKRDQEQMLLLYLRRRYNSKADLSKLLNLFVLDFIADEAQKDSVDSLERLNQKDYWAELIASE